MAEQAFWSVPTKGDDADLWVCMSCLNEVFRGKVPMPDCPSCHGVSTYESFTLEAIQDWGTDDLIAKAIASQDSSAAASHVSDPTRSFEAMP